MVDGEVSTTNTIPRLKIPKSVSFEDSDLSENQHPDTERNSTVAGLRERHRWHYNVGKSNTH